MALMVFLSSLCSPLTVIFFSKSSAFAELCPFFKQAHIKSMGLLLHFNCFMQAVTDSCVLSVVLQIQLSITFVLSAWMENCPNAEDCAD